jgi:hypothetical protein
MLIYPGHHHHHHSHHHGIIDFLDIIPLPVFLLKQRLRDCALCSSSGESLLSWAQSSEYPLSLHTRTNTRQGMQIKPRDFLILVDGYFGLGYYIASCVDSDIHT